MNADKPGGETHAPRDQLSKLSEAGRRISASLDADAAWREVVDSARALTGAGSSGIATMDASGGLQGRAVSGASLEEYQRLLNPPHGPGLWDYVREAPHPVRLRNLEAHLRGWGFPDDPTLARTFLGAPIRYRGAHVGNVYLVDKAGGHEFTANDEEILALLVTLAGAAAAHAGEDGGGPRRQSGLEALSDISPAGVVVFDARGGRITSLNPEARRIAGDAGAPGRPVGELAEGLRIRRADGREFVLEASALQRILRESVTVRAEEIVLEFPDGRRVTTLVNAAPMHSEAGEVETVIVTLEDMTPVEELARLRAQFLSMVSHELRAPLTSIKGCAATVLGTPGALDPAEGLQFFRIIDEQADQMRALVSDLLDATHIEAGMLSVAPEPSDLAVIVDQARKTFLGGGCAKPVQVHLPPALPRVLADRQRIVQVLVNLLSNAARRAPASSAIRVEAAPEGAHVAVSVTDEGPDIPAERLAHLFRRFTAGGRADNERAQGMGLGLAISKGLVEAHGGRIRAASADAGPGARLTFTLPVAGEARHELTPRPAGKPGRPRRTGRPEPLVLVVDDDPRALRYVQSVLKDGGYHPLVTGDPNEMPALLDEHQPDLILLDLLLPGLDGIELMESVPGLSHRPVIFLSGYGRDETISRALEAGAADYIVKPFSPTELLARIQAALRREEAPQEPYRSGNLVIDYAERRVTLDASRVVLTATEYDLLCAMSVNAGRVSTYEYLLHRVWRTRHGGSARSVRAFIKKLRRKLGDEAARPTYIFSEHGVGYRMPEADDG